MKYQQRKVIRLMSVLAAFVPPIFSAGSLANCQAQSDKRLSGYTQVAYCDLIRNPDQYDGKDVAVSASYRYGFEWQEIFCMKCRDQAKTWLEFDRENIPALRRTLRKAPSHEGLINAIFYGTFQGKRGPYGDGGYSYRFDVKFLKDVKSVYRDGRSPTLLPSNAQKQICQE